jgi:hypothetical protein
MPFTMISSTTTVGNPAQSAIPVTGVRAVAVTEEQILMTGARDGAVIIRTSV